MILTEVTSVPQAALPMEELRVQLRLGSGFGNEDLQDGLLEQALRAAIAAIEARTGKALIARQFRLTLSHWAGTETQALPLAPVSAVAELALVDAAGVRAVMVAGRYRLDRDAHRPVVRGAPLPTISTGGKVELLFEAGFGPVWTAVPPDLRQAVLMLEAVFHDDRDGLGAAAMPLAVQALMAPHLSLRLGGGGV